MANMLFTNNAATTLAASINNTVTTITVAAGTGTLFPSPTAGQYFYATLANTAGTVEIVKCTARSTDTLTIVRGQDGTSGVSWVSGDKFELRLVRADLDNLGQLDSANTWAVAQTLTAAPVLSALTASQPVFTDASKNATSTGVVDIAHGGTNNGSLGVTAGGVVYTDGTKQMNTGAGTSGQVLVSAGASAPAWTTLTTSGSNIQTFNASGTWTKPAAAPSTATVIIEAISGGGSGGKQVASNGTGGGGGGCYVSRIISISSLGATEAVTVGAGGTAITGSASLNGNTGGTSSFGSWLSVLGGAGGGATTGLDSSTGSGGADRENGGNGSLGGGGGGGGYVTVNTQGGNGISPGFPSNNNEGGQGGDGPFGGGGGGGNEAASGAAGRGGNTFYGGGGGGGATGSNNALNRGAGGTSVLGGAGGAGSFNDNLTDGVAGTQPGGGGGACSSTTAARSSGAGGAGRVTVTTIW